jgi:hypothetical protein
MFADQAAQQVRQQLAFAADQRGRDSGVARLTALMDFRHAYIANNLTLPGSCTDDNRPLFGSAASGSVIARY